MKRAAIRLCILLAAAGLLGGCADKEPRAVPPAAVAGDKLFVPEGYKQHLSKLKLTEVAALLYFTKPFITIAEDAAGQQMAVVFQTADEAYTVKLPVTFQEMVNRVTSGGGRLQGAASNLHLFEQGNKLIWSFSDGTGSRYWDVNGNRTDPFKSRETTVPDFHKLFRKTAQLRIQYGDGNQLSVTDTKQIKHFTASMQEMTVVPASAPDAVGYTFYLHIDADDEALQYSSAGHFVYRGNYYRCENVDAVNKLNSAVVGYGQEKIPGLLGTLPVSDSK